jgi:hypothetical protein
MAMLPRIKPRTFYDLVIEVAIVRPGRFRETWSILICADARARRQSPIRCTEAADLLVTVKSSCFFCAGMKQHEVRSLPGDYLRPIIHI